ncbi:endonuclease domain-containing protein [uncultured Friedmanniella sp.]|uniref:endonuclease domain-containing protein n=1 Tax=uncultured Friedmanniella sp. TaxID=335381 RepID=UPI0035C9C4C0
MDEVGERLRAGGGVLARRDHRDLSGTLDRLLRTGQLVSPLPGVYCPPELSGDPGVATRAALVWAGPGAVLTGLAAARTTFWPAAPAGPVTLALPTTTKRSCAGVVVERRRVPPELVLTRGAWAVTQPWATAVDLASGPHGGPAIDEALRTGAATLAQMWEAFRLQPGRPGNPAREALLHDSRDEPWSEAEREGHRLLRAAGIVGWKSNRLVGGYWVDVLFARDRLILEIDGWAAHGGRQAFEDDRVRRNALVLAGYRVLNFTWRQLQDEPAWVLSCIHTALGR